MTQQEIFEQITKRKWFTEDGSISDERIVDIVKLPEFLYKYANNKTEESS